MSPEDIELALSLCTISDAHKAILRERALAGHAADLFVLRSFLRRAGVR